MFLHLVITFPSGRISTGWDRGMIIAGYLIFTLANVPAMLVAGPSDFGCDECPRNLLLIERNEALRDVAFAFQAVLYAGLFLLVLARLAMRWRRTPVLERLQLTPVYASGLLTFLLYTIATAAGGDAAIWPAFAATALLPFAFLGGLLRNRRAPRRGPAGVAAAAGRGRRHRAPAAGAQPTRRRAGAAGRARAAARPRPAHCRLGAAARAGAARRGHGGAAHEPPPSCASSPHGIHPRGAVREGLDAALYGLASRAPLPVTLEEPERRAPPEPVEVAAYYAVSEAPTNVAKYANATRADVAVHREDGTLTVDVTDDGIGGADASRGSGLRGLADRVAALDGELSIESPPGQGTRVRVRIPCG